MNSTSGTMPLNANIGTARTGSTTRTGAQFTEAVMRKAHAVFRTKIAEEIAARTRAGLRTAYHWKAGEREMGMADFLALLEGDEALAFLDVFWDHVPATTRERWFRQETLNRRLHAAEKKRRAGEREIEQLRFELNKR